MIILQAKVYPGTTIQEAAEEAVNLARLLGAPLEFEFNDVRIIVRGSHLASEIVSLYHSGLVDSARHRMYIAEYHSWKSRLRRFFGLDGVSKACPSTEEELA